MRALLINEQGPVEEVQLDGTLEQLQASVWGMIEAIPLPDFIDGAGNATAYINGDGKYSPDCEPNKRATDFMVPGVGLFMGDYIAGPMLLCGFDMRTGEHAELPEGVEKRVRLIEKEAG